MDKFEKYKNEYEQILKKSKPNESVINFSLWVGAKWENECNVNPWESEKYLQALQSVKAKNEFALIEVLKEYLKTMGTATGTYELIAPYIEFLNE